MLNMKCLVVIVALVWSGQASGNCVDTGDGRVVCNGGIETIYSRDNGSYAFLLTGTLAPNLPCTFGGTSGWWEVTADHIMRREWYSLLIAAAATNANLSVASRYASATNGQCEVQRIEWRN